jgi:hypothetical protein
MGLTAAETSAFLAHAKAIGHDAARLLAGAEELRDFGLPALDHGRVFSTADDASRARRADHFFNPTIAARRRLGQGVHDRCEAGVFAGMPVAQSDLDGMAGHLPFPVRASSELVRRIPAGTEWDVSARPQDWGREYRDDVVRVVNVGTLILEPGARLVVQGNLFFLLCQRVIHLGEDDPEGWQIGVLATPFSVDPGIGPDDGAPGRDGRHGGAGTDGLARQASPTLLGPMLVRDVPETAIDGTPGGGGTDATNGGPGRTGGAAKIAEITFRSIEGNVTILAAGGDGGNGGAGGRGGDGGQGGNGASALRTFRGELPAGAGGRGGAGGAGGAGGRGGHGGLASNVYVSVPEAFVPQVRLRPLPSRGGAGGRGGPGGRPGASGVGAAPGIPGRAGEDGAPGRDRPAPPMFLNDRPVEPPADFPFDPATRGVSHAEQ